MVPVNSNMPWERRLLSLVEEAEPDDAIPFAIVVGVAATVVLVIFVALCVCGESEGAELKNVKRRENSSNNIRNSAAADLVQVTVEDGPEMRHTSIENGTSGNRNSTGPSRNSQVSVGSGQMRPTSLRELPEPPTQDGQRPASIAEAANTSRRSRGEEDEDDYDHLGEQRKTVRRQVNYDHIKLNSQREQSEVTSASGTGTPSSENYYAQVRDRTYDTVNETGAVEDDPYAKVKDDPYAKVKDDPYAKVKDDTYARLKDEEDPYAKLKGNSTNVAHMANIQVVSVESEIDPYSTLDDGSTVEVVNIQRSSSTSANLEGSPPGGINPPGAMCLDIPDITDDYAVVNKSRMASTASEMNNEDDPDPYVIPPEPPRGYNADEAATSANSRLLAAGASPGTHTDSAPEREYTMVTARESLASMTARNALNPYEIVLETENMYATVDGGSGDGIIQQHPPSSGGLEAPSVDNRLSTASETYAEIGGPYAISAPVPPSLDSLHMMTKQHQDERRHLASPEDSGISGISGAANDYAVVNKRSSFSPSATKLPDIPGSPNTFAATPLPNGAVGATSAEVTLDPNYQKVKDCITDNENENDPNYESVEEAKSRPAPKRQRQHVYEEVSPTSPTGPSLGNASVVRDRVLHGHMYEDITEVKEQQNEWKRQSGDSRKEKFL